VIKAENENLTKCASCGKPAIRRQVFVHHPGLGGRFVVYETHSDSMGNEEHGAALRRCDDFHLALYKSISSLRLIDRSKLTLAIGIIQDIELASVMPSACEVRSFVKPLITVRAFDREQTLELPARELASIDADALIKEAKIAASEVTIRIKTEKEAGR